MKYKTIDEVLQVAQIAEGTSFKQYDIHHRLDSKGNKGGLGQIIEEGLFKYDLNSRNEADFAELGVELKVTPLKLNKKNQLQAKERLVLNIINYMEEYKHSFETSSFWKKNEKLLIMFYLWQESLSRGDYKILKSLLHQFSSEDLLIIKNDWQCIIDKIKAGKADELSESDTLYLAACTKGSNKNTVRDQPFSPVKAKQRAFSLKPSYITAFARSMLNQEAAIALTTASELKRKSLNDILEERFAPYYGLSLEEISNQFNYQLNSNNKSEVAKLTSMILGVKGTYVEDIAEFQKANIQFKTIRLEPNGTPKEHMSFEQIDFNRLINDSWENSQFYEKFEYTKFLFVVFEFKEAFKPKKSRPLYLKKVLLWNMPESTIQSNLRELWENTRQIVKDGVILTPTSRGIKNNLPGAKDNPVCHIRPKAINAADKVLLPGPNGVEITKQCYWLNRDYVANIVK
ncbi:Sau3AI family type II restriction endonuclease [uncultured Veillonella sp.]|uniref:Sau3AI family type II restriction endonuclease n=1 Tax=uncultured Veillonella sp. TaxID=159268 RepID=UPI0026166BAC|nr:Sau3AI family type II restriction endonuclease [uncultured Veillonella sp.]